MTNRKLHVRFQLAPRLGSMIFEYLEVDKSILWNLAWFRRFGSQQRLNEWK